MNAGKIIWILCAKIIFSSGQDKAMHGKNSLDEKYVSTNFRLLIKCFEIMYLPTLLDSIYQVLLILNKSRHMKVYNLLGCLFYLRTFGIRNL